MDSPDFEKKKLERLPVRMHLQEGDIITSKKGFLQQSPTSNEFYLVKRLKFVGGSYFEALSDKEPVDIKELPKK